MLGALYVIQCTSNGGAMNQSDWKRIKQSRMKRGMIDLLRRNISREEYEKIVEQTYEEYREEARW